MDNLWWGSVPDPSEMIRQITEAMQNGNHVVCLIPEQLEWHETFRSMIAAECRDSIKTLKIIDAQKRQDKLPGELLLTEYVTHPTVAEGYRRSFGYARYLAENDAVSGLSDHYFFVQNASGDSMKEWIRFMTDYQKAHKPDQPACVILLECTGKNPGSGNGLQIVDYQNHIKDFDILILCMMASSGLEVRSLLRNYAAGLAAELGSHDPEFAAELIRHGTDLIRDPEQTVRDVAESSFRSNGAVFPVSSQMAEKIWRAQVKTFFPVIEEYRLQLIRKYEKEFPVLETITGTFGQDIEDVWDIDLGTLKYLCDTKKMYLPGPEYQEMCFYRDCRNALAHTNPLPYVSLDQLAAKN